MSKYIDVFSGQVVVTSQRYHLRSMAIGSCIVVSVHDQKIKLGGMAHIMLPGRAAVNIDDKERYADNAILKLTNLMQAGGSVITDFDVCLVGAGNVLQDEYDTICSDNIRSVTEILTRNNISVKACCLGGYERKAIILDCMSGQVQYSCGSGDFEVLWPK